MAAQTLAAWQKAANKGFEERGRRQAVTAVKIDINVDDLVAFCRDSGRKIDRTGRRAFVKHQPVPADYDGDGRTDLAIYRGGEWWTLFATGYTANTWGVVNDVPVPGR